MGNKNENENVTKGLSEVRKMVSRMTEAVDHKKQYWF
jgi:hypothetical protein